MNFRKLLVAICLTLTLFGGVPCARGQSGDDISCVVSVFDASAKNWGAHALPIKELGQFTIGATDNPVTPRAFRLEGTGLFAVAGISRHGDSESSEDDSKSISLSLIISRKQRLNIRQLDLNQVVHSAAADVNANDLNSITVSTVVRRQRRSRIVLLGCRKTIQP